MTKYIEGLFGKKGIRKKELKRFFKKKSEEKIVCYVLITCTQAETNDKMEVKMKFEGEEHLASYMVETASNILKGEH